MLWIKTIDTFKGLYDNVGMGCEVRGFHSHHLPLGGCGIDLLFEKLFLIHHNLTSVM